MAATVTIPQAGDSYTWSRWTGREYNESLRQYVSQYETVTDTVKSVSAYMDNSIELNMENGACVTFVAPHGDIC